MLRTLGLISLFCFMLAGHTATAADHPSAGAKGMAGALGTFSFKPADWKGKSTKTWWKDSDGVAPGVAGCHIGTDSKGKPNGRTFGEACLADGTLVESNPGLGVLHSHGGDTGHPDKFNCSAWCKAKGKSKGMCVAVKGPAPCATSARCECN